MAWQLPPGIEDYLPPRAAALEAVRARLLALFQGWGYELVIPPLVEYAEALLTGTGADLEAQTFRMVDPLSGAMLGVRADMTPQAARIDARHFGTDVVRLCYLGSVLTATQAAPGATRNPLQVGAELYGHAGIEADVEVLRLMLALLEAGGGGPTQLDLGHVGIYRALARAAGLDPDTEHAVFGLLQRKALPELRLLLAGTDCPRRLRDWLAGLGELYGGVDELSEARARLAGAPADVLAALDALEAIARELQRFEPQARLSFDLAELRGYGYHTGAVFAAYLPGQGQAIARGGRYDGIGRAFGRDRPATGFSAELDRLIPPPAPAAVPVQVPWDADPELARLVDELRAAGRPVVPAFGAAPAAGPRVERVDGRWRLLD